jgi:uncharacterized protein (TIGR04255 family)
MAPVIAQMIPASQGEGQLLKHPLRPLQQRASTPAKAGHGIVFLARIVIRMNNALPIEVPDRLPTRIDPCPIVEAIAEIRFVSAVPEQVILGLIYAQVRERFPGNVLLPLALIPVEARLLNPALIYQPTAQFPSEEFLIQVGSRVAGLAIKPTRYPGWPRMRTEIAYLFEALQKAAFISEAERLALRYTNFFEDDVYQKIKLNVLLDGKAYRSHEMAIMTSFPMGAATARLSVANNAVATIDGKAVPGSILDVDVWFSSLDFDLFERGLESFEEAHLLQKQIFFGLLKPEVVASLNPIY